MDPDWKDLGAESLIHALVLYTYFPEFAGLFEERSFVDRVDEFLAYIDQRKGLRASGEDDQLGRIERDLPVCYPVLARDAEFLALIRSIAKSPVRAELIDKLHQSASGGWLEEKDGFIRIVPWLAWPRVLWVGDSDPDAIVAVPLKFVIEPDASAAGARANAVNARAVVVDVDCLGEEGATAALVELMQLRAPTPVFLYGAASGAVVSSAVNGLDVEQVSTARALGQALHSIASPPTL